MAVRTGARVHIPAYQSEGLEVAAVGTKRKERARETIEAGKHVICENRGVHP